MKNENRANFGMKAILRMAREIEFSRRRGPLYLKSMPASASSVQIKKVIGVKTTDHFD
jgi:hypothetical protein